MTLFAEISDKMPTIAQHWILALALSLPALVGIKGPRVSWIVLLGAILFSAWLGYWKYQEAYLEGTFSSVVRAELGRWWIANSIASAFLPTLVAFVIVYWHVRKRGALPQSGDSD